jgi:hypothetical protein
VKRISPETKVFVSFQWDWARVLDQKEADKIDEHSKLFDIFRPELDVVALTSYPAVFYKIPAELPPDYYSSLDKHVRPNDQVFFIEIGWPSSGTGNEEQQLAFIRRLPELLNDTKVNVLIWALLHDVNLAVFGADLNSVGLLTNSGRKKPAYDAFESLQRHF